MLELRLGFEIQGSYYAIILYESERLYVTSVIK